MVLSVLLCSIFYQWLSGVPKLGQGTVPTPQTCDTKFLNILVTFGNIF